LDNAIKEFLSGRKIDRIKKKINANMTPEETFAVEQGAHEEFLLENWLPGAAKRANQLSMVSHPIKFSHPSAKTSSIIADGKRSADGFLRTGNASCKLDVFGNAAALDVFKFLSLTLSDGKTILEHLENPTEKITNDLNISSVTFEEIRAGFLSIKKMNEMPLTTSSIVKQVYFPVEENYHLLSILTPSALMFELRNRIQHIRFSEQAREAKADKKKNAYNEMGFDDLYGLSMIGYGGTKPQNISVLNSTYGGKAYLLSSAPPVFVQPKQILPKNNFFMNTLWPKSYRSYFIKLHKLFKNSRNNVDIRDERDDIIQALIDYLIEKMWSVRSQPHGWSAGKNYSNLPSHQKIWLDDSRIKDREMSNEWLQEIVKECAHWFTLAYKKVIGKKSVLLAKADLAHIEKIIEQSKEGLR
jgi:CRISPR-associated protein Csy1